PPRAGSRGAGLCTILGRMQSAANDPRELVKAGVAAMREGDPARARDFFMRATAASPSDVPAWIGLAHAYNSLKDVSGKLAALDKALSLDPRNLRALLL